MEERELLLAAGLTPAIVDDVLALYAAVGEAGMVEALAAASDPDAAAAKRQARLTWWAGDHIPQEFKRLLDATVEGAGDLTIIDVNPVQTWNETLQRFAVAGEIDSDLAQEAISRAWDEAWVAHGDFTLPTSLPEAKSWPALLDATGDDLPPTHPFRILSAYLEAQVAT